MDLVLLSIIFLLLIAAYKLSLRPTNFPPGPRGVPLLGYGPLLPKNVPVYKTLQKLSDTYGSVTGFYVGPTQAFVSVVGQQAVKEVLLNDDFNSRPSSAIILSRTFGEKLGLIFTDGALWQEQRRFTLRHLRDLGFGKTSIEDQMMDEISDLLSDIKSAAQSDPDHIVDFNDIFTISIINTLWAILCGKRYQREDAEFKKLLALIVKFLRGSNPVAGGFPLPAFLIRLFPSLPKLFGLDTELFLPIQEFIKENIEEHLATRSKEDVPRDFFDVYLDEMEEQSQKNPSTYFSKKQLIAASQDLFAAGSDTSTNSIGFAVLYLINYPEIQEKVQRELDNVCGDSLPSLAHRVSLPYTEAFIAEVMRIRPIAPLAVPHLAAKDTQLQGFTIPKGAIVTVNLESVFKDPAIWKDPEDFQPERHLNEDGSKLIRKESITAFGLGKRMCLGEPLARMTTFLFIAALAKTFEFKPIPNQPPPTLDPAVGIVASPKPFKAVAIPRIC